MTSPCFDQRQETSKTDFLFSQRLHDYYRYNLSTFVNEGAIETEEVRAETSGELTVWDAFKIGVKGANSMLLGSGIDIMLEAFNKVIGLFVIGPKCQSCPL